jgi:hypothetical protein
LSIGPLTLREYKALVAGIPIYSANAIFTVTGQTSTVAQSVTFIDGVLSAVAQAPTASGTWKDATSNELSATFTLGEARAVDAQFVIAPARDPTSLLRAIHVP